MTFVMICLTHVMPPTYAAAWFHFAAPDLRRA